MTGVSVRVVFSCLSLLALVGCAGQPNTGRGVGEPGKGVELTSNAVVYFGSASFATRPAVIAFERVRDASPEWKTIQQERVREGTARFNLLRADMHQHIVEAAKRAAKEQGCDLVVRAGDIVNANGLTVVDLTDKVSFH